MLFAKETKYFSQ